MLLPRVLATGLWLAATVGSTALVWAATSVVAADVTDRPPAVVALRDVEDELAANPALTATPTSTTTQAQRPSGPRSTAVPGGATNPASPQLPPRSPAPQAGVTFPSSPATTTPPAQSSPRPVTPPPTQRAQRPTATYSTPGGVVKVACDGDVIDLIFAIPSNGYSVKVEAAGPGNVDVRFLRSGRGSSVKAACSGQPFRYDEKSPPPRQPPASP